MTGGRRPSARRLRIAGAGLRLGCAGAALLLLSGCGGEPDEAAIREGLEVIHTEWAEQARQVDHARQKPPEPGTISLPKVDLAAEARLDLKITEVRKLACRQAEDHKLGYRCMAEVKASIAGRPPVNRRIEGRFVAGWSKWVATEVHAVDVN
ncbi:MAG: hypothetical protein IT562_02935 [Alphaproteobacteria bacterium]|nr:hypothetical protein [Alphaproteobacteria bacterium]